MHAGKARKESADFSCRRRSLVKSRGQRFVSHALSSVVRDRAFAGPPFSFD